ncbi:MAG: hypothetical protein KC616_20415 [Myxococcales bacterium]|nr:hypothetical protein [Myxococcales bacterium]
MTRHLFVPLERGGLGVSRHELAHVRWSPRRFPRVRHPLIVLQAVEDARINLGLERIGLVVTLDREQLAHVAHLAARDAKAGDVAATVIRAVASLGTEGEAALREEIAALPGFQADLARRLVEDVEARLLSAAGRSDRPVAPFRVAREAARDLARRLEQYDLLRPDHEVEGLGCCHVLLDGEARDGIGFELPWPDPREPEARRRAYAHRYPDGSASGEGVAPGAMSIATPPLVERQPRRLHAGVRRRVATTEGTFVRRPDRFAIDRAIFVRRVRGEGGTILVDVSGSMSFGAKGLEALVRAAGGAAVVAIYSGSGDVGELRIVARGDRRVASDQLEPVGRGNIVDLPALEWLARQPEPRLWVSDGCVTGVGDSGCDRLRARCEAVAQRGRIRRVDTPDAAVRVLEGG